MPPTTLVLGASGRLGREVSVALAQRGHAVRGGARDAGRVPEPATPIRADLLDPTSLRAACRGAEAVVLAAGAPVALRLTPGHPGYHAVDHRGTLNLLNAARDEGVRRVVYVSVFAPPGFRGGRTWRPTSTPPRPSGSRAWSTRSSSRRGSSRRSRPSSRWPGWG